MDTFISNENENEQSYEIMKKYLEDVKIIIMLHPYKYTILLYLRMLEDDCIVSPGYIVHDVYSKINTIEAVDDRYKIGENKIQNLKKATEETLKLLENIKKYKSLKENFLENN